MDTPSTNPNPSQAPLKPYLLAAAVLVPVLIGGYFLSQSKDDANPNVPTADATTQSPPAQPMEMPSDMPITMATYKDGTYSATGHYVSPGGLEDVGLTVTLKDGVIVDSVLDVHSPRPISQNFQGLFAANYKPLVIGKNIDDVKLSKVSGSSLTSGGFNDALEQIKAQASA